VVSEDAAWVAAWYWDSRLVNVVYAVFNNSIINYNVLITGNSGVGKTTYAYYGLKVGYIKFLLANRCSERGGVYCVEGNARRDFNEELEEFKRRHVPLFDEAKDWVWRRVSPTTCLMRLRSLNGTMARYASGLIAVSPMALMKSLGWLCSLVRMT